MRSLRFPLLISLISHLLTPALAIPISSSSSSSSPSALLAPRANTCDNDPTIRAGSPLTNRNPPRIPSLPFDPPTITWCDLHSSTYLIITMGSALADSSVARILDDASHFVTQMIQRGGDGLIPRGFWNLEEYGLELAFINADNHQQTWGVIGAALMALVDYFVYRVQVGSVRAITFQVWDGRNLVGHGWLKG